MQTRRSTIRKTISVFRRLRLVADGTGYGVFDFRLQMTLEPGQGSNDSNLASPDVKDSYVSMNEIPGIGRFRIGNFFVPFGLEQVTNDTNNIFNERSIPPRVSSRQIAKSVVLSTTAPRIKMLLGQVVCFSTTSTKRSKLDSMTTKAIDSPVGLLGCLTMTNPQMAATCFILVFGVLYTDDQNNQVRFPRQATKSTWSSTD